MQLDPRDAPDQLDIPDLWARLLIQVQQDPLDRQVLDTRVQRVDRDLREIKESEDSPDILDPPVELDPPVLRVQKVFLVLL